MARKKKTDTINTVYFGDTEEKWFLEYINSKDENYKNFIYSKYLKEPFDIMIDLILKTLVKINPSIETFDELKEKMQSQLALAIPTYKIEKGRAYTYLSYVIRNYGWYLLKEGNKEKKINISYDDISHSVENNFTFSYEIDVENDIYYDKLMNKIVSEVQKELEYDYVNKNERLVGATLIEIFKNKEFMYDSLGNSNKFDKTFITTYLRERTGLGVKDLRESLLHFKSLYFVLKKSNL